LFDDESKTRVRESTISWHDITYPISWHDNGHGINYDYDNMLICELISRGVPSAKRIHKDIEHVEYFLLFYSTWVSSKEKRSIANLSLYVSERE